MNLMEFYDCFTSWTELTAISPSETCCSNQYQSLTTSNQPKTNLLLSKRRHHTSEFSTIAKMNLPRLRSKGDLKKTKATCIVQGSQTISHVTPSQEELRASSINKLRLAFFKQLTFEAVPASPPFFYQVSHFPKNEQFSFFTPLFDKLGFLAIFVAERRDTCYIKDLEGRIFRVAFFKEKLVFEDKSTVVFSKLIGSAAVSHKKLRTGSKRKLQPDYAKCTPHQLSSSKSFSSSFCDQEGFSSTYLKKKEDTYLAPTPPTTGVQAMSDHNCTNRENEVQQPCIPTTGWDVDLNFPLISPMTNVIQATPVLDIDKIFSGQVADPKNQLTQGDLCRLKSLGTLPNNPTFRAKSGREFYNSKMTIAGFYKFFAPYLTELGCEGVLIVERRDKFYDIDFKGKIFTAIYFKEVQQPIANRAAYAVYALGKAIKDHGWNANYQDTEDTLTSQYDNAALIKINDHVVTMVDRWGFEEKTFRIGLVKKYDPTSQYRYYVLLFNKENMS